MKKYRSRVSLASVELGERFRKKYEVGDLIESVQARLEGGEEKGFIHPPVVKEYPEGTDGKQYLLLAGGRRMAAAMQMGWEEVDVDVWPASLTELDLRVVELEENLHREKLDWWDEVALKEEIANLAGIITGKGEEASVEDAAEIAGIGASQYYKDLRLARYVEKDPELKKAKTKSDALKIINKAEEKILQREIAARLEQGTKLQGIDGLRKRLINSYILGDFLKQGQKIPDRIANFIELDPPYGIDYGNAAGGNRTEEVLFSDDPEVYYEFMVKTAKESYRIAKDGAWLICWHAIVNITPTIMALKEAGWIVSEKPLLWVKPDGTGRCRWPEREFTVNYEPCLYARKGEAALIRNGPGSVFSFNTSMKRIHPTEKPIDLLTSIYKCFMSGGEYAVVPFLGSGNSLFAMNDIGVKAFGYDLEQSYKDAFTLRVQEKINGPTADDLKPRPISEKEKQELKERAVGLFEGLEESDDV